MGHGLRLQEQFGSEELCSLSVGLVVVSPYVAHESNLQPEPCDLLVGNVHFHSDSDPNLSRQNLSGNPAKTAGVFQRMGKRPCGVSNESGDDQTLNF